MTVRSVSRRGLTEHCGLLPLPSIRRGDENLSSQGRRLFKAGSGISRCPMLCLSPKLRNSLSISICTRSDVQTFLYPGIHEQLPHSPQIFHPRQPLVEFSFCCICSNVFWNKVRRDKNLVTRKDRIEN